MSKNREEPAMPSIKSLLGGAAVVSALFVPQG